MSPPPQRPWVSDGWLVRHLEAFPQFKHWWGNGNDINWHVAAVNTLDKYMICRELNLAQPHNLSHKPGLSGSFIKMGDRLNNYGGRKKEPFLEAKEAWNHLERGGMIQMNEPWVWILISGKHLSFEMERTHISGCRWRILSFVASSHFEPLFSPPLLFLHISPFFF